MCEEKTFWDKVVEFFGGKNEPDYYNVETTSEIIEQPNSSDIVEKTVEEKTEVTEPSPDQPKKVKTKTKKKKSKKRR